MASEGELQKCVAWMKHEKFYGKKCLNRFLRQGKKSFAHHESLLIMIPAPKVPDSNLKQVRIVTSQKVQVSCGAEVEELSDEALWQAVKDKFKLGEQLSLKQKDQLLQVLKNNLKVFAKSKTDIGMCEMVVHEIDTGTAKPIKQRPYRLTYAEEREAHRQIAELIAQGRVRPCNSPWASPVVMAVKKDKINLRLCIDMRALNKVTKPWSYPLPHIQDVLDRLGKSKYFAVCDVLWGFWNVPLRKEDQEKTAFVTRGGQWCWTVMPFGLINAPATFQHLMNTLFDRNVFQDFLEVFIDDLCVHHHDWSDFLVSLDKCLRVLNQSGLKLSIEKCEFGFSKVGYLGHIVSAEGISPDPSKVDAALKLLPPKTVTEVRAFLGLTGYYRRFVKSYALIAKPLNLLTQKDTPFVWTDSQQKAFELLKQKLVEAPILMRPDPEKAFILDTDYQHLAIAAVLSQIGSDGLEHPVAFASKGLNKTEQRWPTIEGELFAIVWAIDKFRQYLDNGLKFLLRTDHKPLQYLHSMKNPSRRVAGWIDKLQGFNFTIQHRDGKKHGNADGLSRARNLGHLAPATDDSL